MQLECEPWAEFLSAGRADATRELHADYAASKAYRALFNASISEACGEGRNEIDHFITGLPVSQMRQPQLVERLTAQLTGTHQVVPKREIQVHKVSVLPQPVGTLNYIYSTYEATDDLDEGVILVLDPGFFSVDWVVFRRGDIVRDSSNSSMEAMSALSRRSTRLSPVNMAVLGLVETRSKVRCSVASPTSSCTAARLSSSPSSTRLLRPLSPRP